MQYLKSSATRCYVSTSTSIIQSEQIATNGRCGHGSGTTGRRMVHLQAEQLSRRGVPCSTCTRHSRMASLCRRSVASVPGRGRAGSELPDVVPLELDLLWDGRERENIRRRGEGRWRELVRSRGGRRLPAAADRKNRWGINRL